MRIRLLKLLYLFWSMICDEVSSSSRISYLQNHTLEKYGKTERSIVEEFFSDLKKVYIDKNEPRQVTITGVSKNYDIQRAIGPFLSSYPHIICTDTEECEYPKIFSQGNFVIIFLNDLTEETFMKNIRIISRCRKCRVLFLCGGIIQNNDVRLMFTLATEQNVPYSELAHFDGDGIGLYSEFLGKNCTMEARLVDIWRPGIGLEKINRWVYRYYDRKGCPVVISSLTFTPKMMIQDHKNGLPKIVGGREGNLILEAARQLNFSILLKHPSVVDRMKYSRKAAIMMDVASGKAEIGIGRLRQSGFLHESIAFSVPYDEECVTWGVPRIMSWSNDIVFVEFSGLVWASFTLIFGIICLAGYIHRKFTSLEDDDKQNFGIVPILCEVFALHLGNPVLWVTSSPGGRYLLISCLYYATVITTAYKTSLASILATDKGTSAIVDAQGIFRANLSVGGSLYDWHILKDQVNDSQLTAKLFKRFIVNNNDIETFHRLKCHRDYAYLGRRSWLSYERQKIVRAHESVTFDIFHTCVLAYHTVISFPKKSSLRKPMDRIIQRLVESGIFNHWDLTNEIDADMILARKSDRDYIDHRATHKFQNIFIVYLVCVTLSLFVFIIELLVAKLKSKERKNAKQHKN